MSAKPETERVSRLERWEHTAFDGTPYFDEELQVPQSTPHRIQVGEVQPILAMVAAEAGLRFLSDEPIWYLHPETDEQRVFYGDLVFAQPVDTMRITAEDLLLVVEVVSTRDRRKVLKDMHFQRLLNEYNYVPEFALVFPDLEDPRALTWFRLSEGQYLEHSVGPGARVSSAMVPGLEFEVLPREQWLEGYKYDVYYRGVHRPRMVALQERAEHETARAEQEKARADEEKARADEEKARADEEKARAEQEKARAERLVAQLRALGIDPDA